MNELRAAIQAFDLDRYLADQGSDWVKSDERALTCPHCLKRKLIVNLEKRAWHCWHCEKLRPDAHGGLLDLVQLLEGVSREQARDRVLQGFHGVLPLAAIGGLEESVSRGSYESVEIEPPAHCQRVIDYTGILPYCQGRGITRWDAECFGLMWCSRGRYANRLIFPVWEDVRLVYWQARAMWEAWEQPGGKYTKSLNPPKTEGAAGAGDVLFNLNQARHYPSVVITEGPIDAIHVGPDAVCSFGKRLSPMQIGKLVLAGVRKIELMWDGPSPKEPRGAWQEMYVVADQLKELFEVSLVFVSRGDPGDHSREANRWFRQHTSLVIPPVASNLMEV